MENITIDRSSPPIDGFLRVKNGRWYNLLKPDNTLLSKEQWFDHINGMFCDGLMLVGINGKHNWIDKEGKLLLDIPLNEWPKIAGSFINGKAQVKIGKKWNFIDTKGNVLLKNGFEYVDNSDTNGFLRIKSEGKLNYLKHYGCLVWDKPVEDWFDEAFPFYGNSADVTLHGTKCRLKRNGELETFKEEKPKRIIQRRLFMTEQQVKKLKENIEIKMKGKHPIDCNKVKAIAKYLDTAFKRGQINGIGDDGFPTALPIVGMIGCDGEIIKNLTDVQLFYLLQDRFKNLYDDVSLRDTLLKQIIKDWYSKKISKEGLLSVNMI